MPDVPPGWTDEQVAAFCRLSAFQDALEQVCDALWFDLRYSLPGGQARQMTLLRDAILPQDALASQQCIAPFTLLSLPSSPSGTARRHTRLEGQFEAGLIPRDERRPQRLIGADPVLSDLF
jgi:hypothetical protein